MERESSQRVFHFSALKTSLEWSCGEHQLSGKQLGLSYCQLHLLLVVLQEDRNGSSRRSGREHFQRLRIDECQYWWCNNNNNNDNNDNVNDDNNVTNLPRVIHGSHQAHAYNPLGVECLPHLIQALGSLVDSPSAPRCFPVCSELCWVKVHQTFGDFRQKLNFFDHAERMVIRNWWG